MCASFCINFYYIPEIVLKYDGKAAVNNKILNVVYSQKHEEIMVLMSRENTFKQNLCISGITKLRNLNMYEETFILHTTFYKTKFPWNQLFVQYANQFHDFL